LFEVVKFGLNEAKDHLKHGTKEIAIRREKRKMKNRRNSDYEMMDKISIGRIFGYIIQKEEISINNKY
jgi:hypothetical protein